jgi:hypothetical protein
MSSSISPLPGHHAMFTSSTMTHGHEVMAWTEAETTKFLHDLQDHSGRFCTAMAQNSKWRQSNEAANPGSDSSTRFINTAQRRSRKGMFSKDVVIYIYFIISFGISRKICKNIAFLQHGTKIRKENQALFAVVGSTHTPLLNSLGEETITDTQREERSKDREGSYPCH